MACVTVPMKSFDVWEMTDRKIVIKRYIYNELTDTYRVVIIRKTAEIEDIEQFFNVYRPIDVEPETK